MSSTNSIAAVPVFAWEMSLAARLIVKGFTPARYATGGHRAAELDAAMAAE